jgi:hypothetical protein
MIVNEETAIVGRDVVLVPYRCGNFVALFQPSFLMLNIIMEGRSGHVEVSLYSASTDK